MKRKVKIVIAVIVICIVAVAVVLIQMHNSNHKTSTNQTSQDETVQGTSFSEKEITHGALGGAPSVGNSGLFYKNMSNEILEYLDPSTKETVPVCSRANCTHESYSQNTSTECEADIHNIQMVVQQGENIYLISNNFDNEAANCTIYRENIDGSDREKMTEIPNTSEFTLITCQASSEYIAINYIQNYEVEHDDGSIENAGKQEYGLLVYDIVRDKSRIVSLQGLTLDLEKINSMPGFTLGKKQIGVALSCYDNSYDAMVSDEMKGSKREAYEQEHMNIQYVRIDLDSLDGSDEVEYSSMIALESIENEIAYYENGLFYFRENGKLSYKIYKEDGESSGTVKLKGIDNGKDVQFVSVNGISGDDLYYSVDSQKADTVYYYYCNLSDTGKNESCGNGKYAIEGVTEDYVYFACGDGNGGYDRTAMDSEAFRTQGMKGNAE